MPLVITLKTGEEIDVLGVTLRASTQCKLSLNDMSYRAILPKDGQPRRIIKVGEGKE